MPTESSVPPPTPPTQAQPCPSPSASLIKCSLCGAGGLSSASASLRSNEGVVVLHDPIERICGGCVRAEDIRRRMDEAVSEEGEDVAIGLGLRGIRLRETSAQSTQSSTGSQETDSSASEEEPVRPRQEPISILAPPTLHPDTSNSTIQSQSLPPEPSRSWSSTSRPSLPVPAPAPAPAHGVEEDTIPEEETDNTVPNNLLDICKSRIDSSGKGALHPGSIFKGTQTSGRSAYEVEVKIVDVNIGESSVSGYLTIAHLTDAHPQLTTFFTGEIIGPKYGFITGSRFGATEHDDMRHWGRFEQFRRPSTRGDMLRPELLFRDPLPDTSRGETRAKDRDFLFLRIKERFLVPDHKVKDISGASFAGFYYAMIDFSPNIYQPQPEPPVSPTSPRTSMMSPPPPMTRRRSSENAMQRRASMSDYRTARSRLAKVQTVNEAPPTEATIRGYYFHSLNQEPFQELFLTNVPTRSMSTFEMR